MQYKNLEIEKQGLIKTIRLNRPEKGNSLSLDLMCELTDLATNLHKDTETRVVVFAGKGKNFCTGADLSDPRRGERSEQTLLEQMRSLDEGPNMVKAIYQIPQITIAALNGKVLGGGACIASACDFRIGNKDTEIGYPEANYGMNLSWLGLPLCVHLVGPAIAKRMVILAKREKAEDLYRWGFIDTLVNDEDIETHALAMAKEYSDQPPMAAQMIKRSVNHIVSALDQAVMHMDKDQFLLTNLSEDYKEGLVAFLQNREAKFTGN